MPVVSRGGSSEQAADELLSAIGRRERFVVLTGAAGAGKTTVCRAVIGRADPRTFTAMVYGPFDDIEGVLRALLAEYGVISAPAAGPQAPRSTLHDLRVALRDFLRSIDRLDARATVFVDDAHEFSVELLERVLALADIDGDKPLLQIVLVGRPALRSTLEHADLRAHTERGTAHIEVGRLGDLPLKAVEPAPQALDRLEPEPPPPGRRRMSLLTAVLMVLVVLLGGVAAWIYGARVIEILSRVGQS